MSFYPKGVSGFALKPCKKLRKGNKRRQTRCRCWLGSPGTSGTKSPAPLAIPCAFPTGFFGWDMYFIYFFFSSSPLKCVAHVHGTCWEFPPSGPGLMDPAAGELRRCWPRGLLAQLRLSFRCRSEQGGTAPAARRRAKLGGEEPAEVGKLSGEQAELES